VKSVDGSGARSSRAACTSVGKGTVSAEEVGSYDITAILDGQSDTESFTVTAGTGASIDLVLSSKSLEVGDSATAEVTIRDAAGNDANDPYTLDVTGVPATIGGDAITFQGEGWFTVTATIDGTSISDSVGPVLIDSSGPDIELSEPPRAQWILAGGDDDTESERCDACPASRPRPSGEPLTLDVDGAFSIDDDDA
jgi:hypothetical protein